MSNTAGPLNRLTNTQGLLKPNESLKEFFGGTVFPVIKHLFQILPEAVFVFLILFSILTQNFAHGVLALSLIESILAFSLIGNGVNYFISKNGMVARTQEGACESGFPSSMSSYATLSLFSGLTKGVSFPSPSIAIISTTIGYTLSSLIAYSGELKELGPTWETRIPIAVTLSFLTLLAFVLFRYIAGCEGLDIIVGSLVLGIIIGTTIMFQNMNLLGKESINILGIPTLESRTAAGKSLYVCAPTAANV